MNLNTLGFERDKMAGNIDFKEKFLQVSIESDLSESTLKSYIQVFNAISFMEKLFNKDIYNMDLNEYKVTLHDLALPTFSSLVTYKSVIDKYIAFALEHKLILSNTHAAFDLKKKDLTSLLNTKKSYNRYITYNEYKESLEKLKNYQDKVFIILLWHNLYNSNLEIIRTLPAKNVVFEESKLIYEQDNEMKFVKLELFELEIIKKSFDETKYSTVNDEYKLIDNGYLIKKIKGKKRTTEIESLSNMNRRFAEEIRSSLKNFDIKMIGIATSGVVYRTMQNENFGKRGFLTNYSKEIGASYSHLVEVINIIKDKLEMENEE